jgi:hypothetical protein
MERKTLKDHLEDDLVFFGRANNREALSFTLWMLREFERIAHVAKVWVPNSECDEHPAVCDCLYHENLRAAQQSCVEDADHLITV